MQGLKWFLIDSAEKLNPQASNFLLKMIEEPPPKSIFFLISSEPSKLSLTIRSRIQNLRFQTLPDDVIRELVPDDSPEWVIQGSRGRMDLIEELKEQKEIRDHSFDLWSKVFEDSFSSLEFSKNIGHRKEALLICCFWQQILRDARLLKSGYSDKLIHGDRQQDIKKLSGLSYATLDTLIKKTLEMEADLRANVNYALCFENFVINLQKMNGINYLQRRKVCMNSKIYSKNIVEKEIKLIIKIREQNNNFLLAVFFGQIKSCFTFISFPIRFRTLR